MGDDPGRVEERLHAEAVAALARSGGVVEREDPGLQLRDRVAAHVAREPGREHDVLAFSVHRSDDGAPVGECERGLERLREAQRQVVANPKAIDDRLDRVLALRIECDRFVELVQPAVDAGPDEALGSQALDDARVLALAVADHRGEQHEAFAARARHDRIHHLGDRLRFEDHSMVRTARLADAGEEKPQIVVDLGDGPDRRAGIVRR